MMPIFYKILLLLLITFNANAYDQAKLMNAWSSVVMIRGYTESGSLAYGSGVIVGKNEVIRVEKALLSVGRKLCIEGLKMENAGVTLSKRGVHIGDINTQTNIPNIYVVGDASGHISLVNVGELEGRYAVERMFSKKYYPLNYKNICTIMFLQPEVASVGKTEQELNKNGIIYKKGQFPMRALGRSRASMDLDGFVKILADAKTDEILGVHMIGARCADLIAEAVVAMEFRASAEDISRMSHAHPTFAEAIKEAALAATQDRALHI